MDYKDALNAMFTSDPYKGDVLKSLIILIVILVFIILLCTGVVYAIVASNKFIYTGRILTEIKSPGAYAFVGFIISLIIAFGLFILIGAKIYMNNQNDKKPTK